MLQQAQIGRELRGGRRDPGQGREHLGVELAGVRLAGDREHLPESHLASHARIQFPHLLVVLAEQLEEAGLGTRRSLDAAELERLEPVQQLLRVEQKILIHRITRLPTVVSWAGWKCV